MSAGVPPLKKENINISLAIIIFIYCKSSQKAKLLLSCYMVIVCDFGVAWFIFFTIALQWHFFLTIWFYDYNTG